MTFAERMRAARLARHLSLVDAAYEIRGHLPRAYWVGHDVIRRLENGTTPEPKASPILLLTLSRVYGVPLSELSEIGDEGARVIHILLDDTFKTESRCSQPTVPLTCGIAA